MSQLTWYFVLIYHLHMFSWYSEDKCVKERPAGHSLFSQQAVSHSKILDDPN